MKRILLTGAGGTAGINFVDSLMLSGGAKKYSIVGTDISKWHIELSPVKRKYVVPRCTEPGYIDALKKIIKRERIDLVHPQPDIEVVVIGKHRDELPARTFLPDNRTIEVFQDKVLTQKAMKSAGVPVPSSFKIDGPADITRALSELAPSGETVWLRATKGFGSRAALPVKTAEQAESWIKYWSEMRGIGWGEFMISEFLSGPEYAFQSVWKDGEMVVSAARQRLEYLFGNITPSGQTSTPSVAVSVENEEVNRIASSAILSVDKKATGIFCADMKTSPDGTVKLTEINIGRFFTTSNFFAYCGVNMPKIYVSLAFGEKVPKLPRVNAVKKGMYWIRSVDRKPVLIKEGKWTSSKMGV